MQPVPPASAGSSARGGRPRDPHIGAAVIEATLTVLDEVGYGPLALEAVARRADTTKPAIYRRWSGKQDLVLAALGARLGDPQVPDTGCTLCDLNEGINVFLAAFRRIRPDVLVSLFADCATDPDLREAFMSTLFEPPRAAVARMLDQAIARGDLRDDIARDLILDMLGSLVHYRALFGHVPNSDVDVEHAVEALLRGIATDYPLLVEHSRRIASGSPTHPAHG
ncbi:MAG: TetR family transcriptional regulator [Pseudonocardiaceae bacterium]|nr:TetR family transcriptional regulator [Pseudonocardiaceae bacterium]